MRKQRLKVLLKMVIGLLLLCGAFLLFERLRGQILLARYKQKLLTQGEKLSPRDFSASGSDANNGAPDVLRGIKRLERGAVLPMNAPPRMNLTPTGRAVIGFRESEWVEKGTYRNGEWVNDKVTNRWEQVVADLKANEQTLVQIRAALAKPVLNNSLDFSQGMKMNFMHVVPPKQLATWLGAASQFALHENREAEALTNLVEQIRLPRMLAEDHLAISELVRIAIAAMARAATWEALQAEGWTDDDLAVLQEAWGSQDFARAMARSLEGERVFGDVSYEMMRRSNQHAVDVLFGLESVFNVDDSERPGWERFARNLPFGEEIAEFLKIQIYCRIWRFAWSHQDQRRGLVALQRLIEIARTAASQQSMLSVQPSLEQLQWELHDRGWYDRLRYLETPSIFALSRAINKAMRAETERSVTICAIALKRHALRHSALPSRLDALVPEFLTSLPVDYMDGNSLKYHLNTDGRFALYSVGDDGKDDGSDTSLLPDKTNQRDLWSRKDFVWPSPALPDEVQAYRNEAVEN